MVAFVILAYLAQGALHMVVSTPAIISQTVVANPLDYEFDPFRSGFGFAIGLLKAGEPQTALPVDERLMNISVEKIVTDSEAGMVVSLADGAEFTDTKTITYTLDKCNENPIEGEAREEMLCFNAESIEEGEEEI